MATVGTYDPNANAAAAREQAEQAAKDAAAYREQAAKGVDDRLAARDAMNADYMERMAQCKPTPTQRECDLFRVGAMTIDDEKEDDGSEWEIDHQRRILSARLPGENPYDTRQLTADNNGEYGEPASGEPPRRGPGRPRKSETA